MEDIKRIYSSKIAGQLCRMGFRVIKTEPNPKKPWLDVFLFKKTEELDQALSEVFTKQK